MWVKFESGFASRILSSALAWLRLDLGVQSANCTLFICRSVPKFVYRQGCDHRSDDNGIIFADELIDLKQPWDGDQPAANTYVDPFFHRRNGDIVNISVHIRTIPVRTATYVAVISSPNFKGPGEMHSQIASSQPHQFSHCNGGLKRTFVT